MKVKRLVAEFLAYCERTRKPNTLRSYKSRLAPLVEQLGKKKLEKIKLNDIEEFLHQVDHWEDGKAKSADTRRANAVGVQKLFNFALERKYIAEPVFAKLEKPRSRRRERIPTDEENAAVEAIAPPEFLRVFRALRRSGARPCELAAATIGQYDRAKRLIVLTEHKTQETGRDRKIGVGEKLEPILSEAIGERTAGPIFLDRQGKAWTSEKLSKTYKRLCRRAGLAEDLCLYLQRHSHATVLCEKAGIHAAASALGHANIQTTMRYVHQDDAQLGKNQDLVD